MDSFLMELSGDESVIHMARLLFSCLLGLLVGYERQAHMRVKHIKTAGLRTHVIVCVASTAMMLISKYGFYDALAYGDNVRVDVSRVAAAIVQGVGFIGAGQIFMRHNSNRNKVTGLTTAAGLWAVAAVGMAIGCGMYLVGISVSVLVLIVQQFSKMKIYRQDGGTMSETIVIRVEQTSGAIDDVLDWIEEKGCKLNQVNSKHTSDGEIQLRLDLYYPRDFEERELLKLYDDLSTVRGIEF